MGFFLTSVHAHRQSREQVLPVGMKTSIARI